MFEASGRSARWLFCALLFTSACVGGQTGTPGSAQGGDGSGRSCHQAADATTALGPSTEALWDAYTGSYTVETGRRRLTLDYELKHADWVDVTVTVSRSDQFEDESIACDQLAAPVEIELQSADGELDEQGFCAIVWAADATYCNFSLRASEEDTSPSAGGILDFDPQFRLLLDLTSDDTVTTYDSNFIRTR